MSETTKKLNRLEFSLTQFQEDIYQLLYQRPSKWPLDQMEVHLTLEKLT